MQKSSQNTSKLNQATYKKDKTPQQIWIYPRNAKVGLIIKNQSMSYIM